MIFNFFGNFFKTYYKHCINAGLKPILARGSLLTLSTARLVAMFPTILVAGFTDMQVSTV